MNSAQSFLAVVGAAYGVLAAWCAASPGKTSKAVGFALEPGAGQSEYLTVYGGLELGLAIVFLWPWIRGGDPAPALFACLAIHGCLVAFRSISFVLYSPIPTTTYILAATEWAIFLGSAFFWRRLGA